MYKNSLVVILLFSVGATLFGSGKREAASRFTEVLDLSQGSGNQGEVNQADIDGLVSFERQLQDAGEQDIHGLEGLLSGMQNTWDRESGKKRSNAGAVSGEYSTKMRESSPKRFSRKDLEERIKVICEQRISGKFSLNPRSIRVLFVNEAIELLPEKERKEIESGKSWDFLKETYVKCLGEEYWKHLSEKLTFLNNLRKQGMYSAEVKSEELAEGVVVDVCIGNIWRKCKRESRERGSARK